MYCRSSRATILALYARPVVLPHALLHLSTYKWNSANFAIMEYCVLPPNAARERKMARNVQGARLSVAYRKMHPGNPNIEVSSSRSPEDLGGWEGSCLATPWATATSFRAFWAPEGWPRYSWPTTGCSAASSR